MKIKQKILMYVLEKTAIEKIEFDSNMAGIIAFEFYFLKASDSMPLKN